MNCWRFSTMAAGGLMAVVLLGAGLAEVRAEAESREQQARRLQWFNQGRFGMFIHWGIYAVPAGEWKGQTRFGEWFMEETKMPVTQYEKFAAQFNPVQFRARQWVRLAKEAGMKYIVITSKHHDGFCMFDSKLTDYCITKATPFHRDPLKELADACRQAGLKLCFYHSIMDWHHPDWGTRRPWNDRAKGRPDMDRYVAYMKGQLKELLTNYGPIGILWFDGEWESPWTHERGVDLYKFVRRLQPEIIINNRVGKGREGMAGMDKGRGVGDYGTPEQEVPATGFGPGVYWESCMTMNDHWGYNKNDRNWKSTRSLIHTLVDCASKGGNYLLNVGPTAEGSIPPPSVQRLEEIGQWMKNNGESIYATSASPIGRPPWGRCTAKGDKVFLHVFDWPRKETLRVEGIGPKVKKAFLLADPEHKALPVSVTEKAVLLTIPEKAPNAIDTVIVLER